MKYIPPIVVTLIILLVGLVILIIAEKFPSMKWIGMDWSSFLSNIGLYVFAVLSFQWFYDTRIRHQTIMKAVEASISNSNVIRCGIENCVMDTKEIDYKNLLHHKDEVIIGFLHSERFVNEHFILLRNRAESGKKTTILCSDPNGVAIEYLKTLEAVKDLVIPSIKNVVHLIDVAINQRTGVKEKIRLEHHDTVLRYSFVHSKDGIWVKMYRNSEGEMTIPGILIRSESPLYDFFDDDINNLRNGDNGD